MKVWVTESGIYSNKIPFSGKITMVDFRGISMTFHPEFRQTHLRMDIL